MNHEASGDENTKGQYYRIAKVGGQVLVRPVKVPTHVIMAREEQKRKKAEARAVRINRELSQALSGRFIAFLTVALVALGLVCAYYLTIQSEVNARIRNVSAMQSQLEQMVSENDSLESRLATAGDLFSVKEAAGEMGMTTPDKSQIIKYTIDNPEYIVQYGSIHD